MLLSDSKMSDQVAFMWGGGKLQAQKKTFDKKIEREDLKW